MSTPAGPMPPIEWLDDDNFRIDGTDFVHTFEIPSTADRFQIRKRRPLVEVTAELLEAVRGGNLVEVGIAQGGGVALLSLLAEPERLVAIELSPTPLPGLATFIERRGRSDTVRPYFGVDQADRARVTEILDAEFGGEPLDLVIDDASHLLEPTRVTFDVLFPRLRPGGWFVIEDWRWQHLLSDGIAAALADPVQGPAAKERLASTIGETGLRPEPPLTRLVVELLLARASNSPAIGELRINDFWVVVERGPAPLDPDTFRLRDLFVDWFGFLPPRDA